MAFLAPGRGRPPDPPARVDVGMPPCSVDGPALPARNGIRTDERAVLPFSPADRVSHGLLRADTVTRKKPAGEDD